MLRIRDVYPGSWFLSIPDLGSGIQEQQQKSCPTFFSSQKYFIFEHVKPLWATLQRIIILFTPKIVTKLLKIWVWKPGSGKKPIPDQKDTGSRIRNTDLWFLPVGKTALFYYRKKDRERLASILYNTRTWLHPSRTSRHPTRISLWGPQGFLLTHKDYSLSYKGEPPSHNY